MIDHIHTPPNNLQAERAVLGGLMLENRMWPAVCEILSSADFYTPAHQLIFTGMEKLDHQKKPIDMVTLADQLERSEDIEIAGGLAYLVRLAEETPSAANCRAYAQAVRESSDRRKLITIGSQLIETATGPASPFEIMTEIESQFLKLTDSKTGSDPLAISEALTQGYMVELENRTTGVSHGLVTGFLDLDRLTSGLRPGQLVVIAGRPSMGKSTLAINIAENIAIKQGNPVLIFSLEMEQNELIDKLTASQAKIPLQNLLNGNLDDYDLGGAVAQLNRSPLYIDDTGGLFINQIRARALRTKRKYGLSLLIVDYLQLIRAKAESRLQEVSEISRSLKALAKELGIPVIALSQLNRGLEQRPDKRPMMSDLRETGQIEQDADLVVFVYRDEVYSPNSKHKNIAELIISKQRNGPTGKVYLTTRLEESRFENHLGPVDDITPCHTSFKY
ncbi:MAG: replicative DNA helicase [Candidatus Thiodiazotropha lotti]|nr:replicative DNA helicase [Candidatus Thiodiazotropha lotti]MCW4222483.1 replicative DNA helicase [Candidatus Thiodiazotropha lotti]